MVSLRDFVCEWEISVISIPASILWKVQIGLRQKLALAGVFSLTVFTIVFAIVRVAVVSSYSNMPDQTWLYLWSAVEQAVGTLTVLSYLIPSTHWRKLTQSFLITAIAVACLGSYHALFVKQNRLSRPPKNVYSGNSSKTVLARIGWQTLSDRKPTNQSISLVHRGSDENTQSVDTMIPNRVHVRSDISTSYSEPRIEGSHGFGNV